MEQKRTVNLDMSSEMRDLAQDTFEQAKKAFEGFVTAAQKAVASFEKQASTARAGAKDVRHKAMEFAQNNVASSFDFAQRIVQARDPQDMIKLQAEFFQSQIQALAEQARELSNTVAQLATQAAHEHEHRVREHRA